MRGKLLLASSAVALMGFVALGEEAAKALKSGLQPGDKTSPFQTRDITGPKKGTSLCYV